VRRRGGASGSTSAAIGLSQCSSAEIPAILEEDFIFQTGSVAWEDGDVAEKCAVLLSPLSSLGRNDSAARLFVLADAETERDEAICFGILSAQGSASATASATQHVSDVSSAASCTHAGSCKAAI